MKILVVTTKSPFPLNEGRALRTYNLIKEMARSHEIHLASFVQDQIDVDGIEHMRSICPVVEVVPLYMGPGRAKLGWDVLREPFGRLPLPVLKYMHPRMARLIADLVARHRYDLVHLDMLHLACYLPQLAPTPVLLMEHNVESQIIARRASTESHPVKRAYLTYQQRKLQRFEADACKAATTVVAVSDLDAEQLNRLSGRDDVVCVPNGVDCDYFRQPARPSTDESNTLVYVGGLTWFPNLDAIGHLRRDILPIIVKSRPDVRVKVIGRCPDNAAVREIQSDPRIELCGMVDDIRPLVQAAAVYIVPLRIGGGTRLKILDALAMSKAIVSTSIGCEGLALKDGEDIVIADSPADFARHVLRLLERPQDAAAIGRRGHGVVREQYDWRVIGRVLDAAYQRSANGHRGDGRRPGGQ